MSDIRASTEGPERFERHLTAAGDLLKQDKVEEAKAELMSALALKGDDIKALGLFGLACFRLASFEEALPVYQKLVELRPNDASYRLNLGLVHLKLGNAAQSIRELVKSRDLDPSQQRTVAYLGLAYARLGDFARAYEAFMRSGQEQLASEMEQHLTDEERELILARLGGTADPEPEMGVASDAYEVLERTGDPEQDGAAAFAEAQARAALAEKRRAAGVKVAEEREEPRTPPPAPPTPALPAPALPTPALEEDAEDEWESERRDSAERAVAALEELPDDTGTERVATDDELSLDAAPQAEEPHEVSDAEIESIEERRSGQMAAMTASAPVAEEARPEPIEEGLLTQAVAMALPTAAAEKAGTRVGIGQTAPLPLTELATARLIRPEDGNAPFEIGAGGVLIIRVNERVLSRTEEVVVSCGDLGFEPATRRVRGAATGEIFGDGDKNLFIVTGKGYLVAAAAGQVFTAVALDEDILYLRETLVFAFEDQLRWENGNVPGSNGQMHVVQFRGTGCVVVRSRRPLLSLKLSAERVVYVEASVLAGWIGRVVPRLVTPAAGGKSSAPFVECAGEGVVLIEDQAVAAAQVGV
ncbi:MAG TPA: tetratricopeptide repeat protein [Kofleriaceae bacterium]|nr:tetratricopeptide repeat protein [Kofleriaceae bacterium]